MDRWRRSRGKGSCERSGGAGERSRYGVAVSILESLLRDPLDTAPVLTIEAWWAKHLAIGARVSRSIDHAILAGLTADRLGWAFATGYRAALAQLVGGQLAPDVMAALCVTEEGGNTPRAIATRLSTRDGGLVLDGEKRWTTLGPSASTLLVAARVDLEGAPRPELRVVAIDARSEGVTMTPMPEAPFVPEIPHASVSLRGVRVPEENVLPGDGYDRYVKPFRTVEDIHVFGAALGHAVRMLRLRGGAHAQRLALEDALAVLAALRGLAEEDPSSAGTHIALAGVLSAGRRVLESLAPITSGDDEASVRWRRDHVLLSVAGNARKQRLERAWSTIPT